MHSGVKAHTVILLHPGEKGLECGEWGTSVDICLTGNKFGRCLVMKISTFTTALVKARTHGLGRLGCQPTMLGGTPGRAHITYQPSWASTVFGLTRTGHPSRWVGPNMGLARSGHAVKWAGPTGLVRNVCLTRCATQHCGLAQCMLFE